MILINVKFVILIDVKFVILIDVRFVILTAVKTALTKQGLEVYKETKCIHIDRDSFDKTGRDRHALFSQLPKHNDLYITSEFQ